MAYFTGSATSFADLLTKFKNHLSVDFVTPYTIDGDVIYKDNVFVKITDETTHLSIIGGTGSAGGGALSGEAPATGTRARNASLGPIGTPTSLQFPVVYFIHVFASPDECYLIVRDDTTRYSHLSFGASPVDGLPTNGNWYHANLCSSLASVTVADTRTVYNTVVEASPMMFCGALPSGGRPSSTSAANNSYFRYGLDGNSWSNCGTGVGTEAAPATDPLWVDTESVARSMLSIDHLIDQIPNTYNDQIILLPQFISVYRGSSAISIVGNLQHMRYTRLTNNNAEDVVIVGGDKWKLYPPLKKSFTNPDGLNSDTASGTYAYAFRYDGV